MLEEEAQKTALLGGQPEGPALHHEPVSGGVEPHVPKGHRLPDSGFRAVVVDPPEQGLDPRHEEMGLEGLGHVVVGAEGQAATVVPVVPAGGQDYHGDAGPSAHLAQHLETVQAREHEVEHHEVGGGIRKGREEVLPVGKSRASNPSLARNAPTRSSSSGLSSTTQTVAMASLVPGGTGHSPASARIDRCWFSLHESIYIGKPDMNRA